MIMLAVIAVMLILGVVFVGYIRGWLGDSGEAALLTDIRGIINMTRDGITYPVEQDAPLREGDVITMGPGAYALVSTEDGTGVCLGERTKITVTDPSSGSLAIEVQEGELFCTVTEKGVIRLSFSLGSIQAQDSVFALGVRSGSASLDVFAGNVEGLGPGETADYLSGHERQSGPLEITSLDSFVLTRLRDANRTYETCFSDDDITALEERRKEEKESAGAGAMNEDLAKLGLEHECTVSIVCRTILDNWDRLAVEKQEFVPEDGIILATVRVPFAEGESAFDATKRACDAYGIQMEYSWTPLYDAFYVEGINHVYEFDCGAESGWMFKVNGWFPNYGASSYILSDGDAIMWEYTCVGLGTDIGGGGM